MMEKGQAGLTQPVRVVVDAQIVLAMFMVSRHTPARRSPKLRLLHLLSSPDFRWLWSPDVMNDCRRGALVLEAGRKFRARAIFDRIGFERLLDALQVFPAVDVTSSTLRAARRRIEEMPRARDRDLDDAIYLACAVDGNAHLLTSQDSDLLLLGDDYEGVRIVDWLQFESELKVCGLLH